MAMAGSRHSLSGLVAQALQQHQSGNLKAAKAGYAEVLKRDPDHAEALNLFACLLDEMGSTGQAVKALTRAVNSNPKAPPFRYNLANMLFKLGRHQDAILHYREAVQLKPDYAVAHNNLGLCLSLTGLRDQAKDCFEMAIRCARAGYPDPHHNLGIELKAEGQFEAAVSAFLEALRIQPSFPDAFCNLGSTYLQMQRVTEAKDAFLKAAQLQPNSARFQTNVGVSFLRMGRQSDAIAWLERALQLDPTDSGTRSNVLITSSYVTSSGEVLLAKGLEWDRNHAMPLRGLVPRHRNVPDPERRLRIGYVSADFRAHAAAYWIEPLLAAPRHPDFEVVCYSNNPLCDSVTLRLRSYADAWVECAGMSDDALADRIRRDGIDILVDLSSHTDGNRLLVFARQPAPVQVGWFGFPVTTGLSAMQYRLTDAVIDPPGSEHFYSERLVRLQRVYAAYRPDPHAPVVGPAPATRGQGVTFASLNTLAKITPATLELWAGILNATPGSRMLLQAAGLEHEALAEPVRQLFAQRGVAAERLLLRGWTPFEEFLQLGSLADIALDSFPFNGGVTTCHALWMGLPVISLRGASAAGRVGASILTRLDLQELVANDEHSYCRAAIELAQDLDRLSRLRVSLRDRMEIGGLLDGSDLAQQSRAALREMWRGWCRATTGH